MKLELKLALIGAVSKIIIFLMFLLVLEQLFDTIATNHTDRNLRLMMGKTLSIVDSIGIRSFLKEEKDSAYASYNLLKEEFIAINLTRGPVSTRPEWSTVRRQIEGEEFDYRILSYTFRKGRQNYTLEIGRNIQIITEFKQAIRAISIATILLVLLITILFDLGIFNYLLRPLNRSIIPKLKTTTTPETYDYSEIRTTTSDFAYLNKVLNDLMHKVTSTLATQKKFIGDVSHELMTPVSVIQSKLENLVTSDSVPQEMVPRLLDIQRQVSRLHQIIRALLLISRIGNDQYPKTESFDLKELADEIVSDIGERASVRQILLENRIDERIVVGDINRSLLQIMLFNLVSNAIKYSQDGGKVWIGASTEEDRLIIEVGDNGPGIPPDQIPRIFDRFHRVRTDGTEGTGLGLSIVKTIVDYYHFSIQVESSVGNGAIFRTILPLTFVKVC
jgi:signal transduction histidine kinase